MAGSYRLWAVAFFTALGALALLGLAIKDLIDKRYAATHEVVSGRIIAVTNVISGRNSHRSAIVEFQSGHASPLHCRVNAKFAIEDTSIYAGASIPVVPTDSACGQPLYPTHIGSVHQSLGGAAIFLVFAAGFAVAGFHLMPD